MRHIPELDGLRAVAVVAVVLFHAMPYGPVSGGFLGVDLFFVLSGYLITSILAAELRDTGRIELRRFYWRRFCRLMPALLFMLAGYLAVAPLLWPGEPHGRDALIAGLYLSDYAYAFWQVPFYLQHTWSLAVEEHFYLVWPLLLPFVLAARRPLIWLASAWVALLLWRSSIPDWQNYYYRFDTHCTGIILGAMLALIPPIRLPRFAPIVAAAAMLVLFAVAQIRLSVLAIPFAELAAAVLILSPGPFAPLLRAAPLQMLGRWSYAIYLWHFPIAYAVRDSVHFVLPAIETLALSIILAAISWHTVEAWGRALRDRIEAARRVEV